MKKLLTLVAALTLLTAVPVFTGCSTANKNTYKATATAQITVDAAMTAWGDWVAHQKALGTPVPLSQEATVKSAYGKYQAAAVVVADAGAAYTRAAAAKDPAAPAAMTALNTALSMAAASLADLTSLIQQFGVKL